METFNKFLIGAGKTIAFPFKAAYQWYMELFCIRITNGKVYYEKSATKAFLTFVRLLTLAMLTTVLAAFILKLGGDVPFTDIKSTLKIRNSLTPAILASFTGLSGVVSILLGYLQKNYTEHKKTVRDNFNPS